MRRLAKPTRSLTLALAALALAGCNPGTPAPADKTATAPAASTPAPAAAPTITAPAPTDAQATAQTTAPAATPAAAAGDGKATPIQVVDGYKVDAETMKGFRVWRAAACDRCHGPNQEGMVGPSLIASLKVLTKDEFVATVSKGRLEKGMPGFSTNPGVVEGMDVLYRYLKGRSDGVITRAKVEPISG